MRMNLKNREVLGRPPSALRATRASIKRVDVYGDQHLEGDDCRGDPLGFRHGGQRLYNTATYDDGRICV